MVLLDVGGVEDGVWYPFPLRGVAPEDRPRFRIRRLSSHRQHGLVRKHFGSTQRLRRRRERDPETGKKVVVTEEQVHLDHSIAFARAFAAEALVAITGLTIRPTSSWAAEAFARALKREVTQGQELEIDSIISDDAVKFVVFDILPEVRDFVFEKADGEGALRLDDEDDPETAAGKT